MEQPNEGCQKDNSQLKLLNKKVRLDFARIKSACTVLTKPLVRWNQDYVLPEWWEEKNIEKQQLLYIAYYITYQTWEGNFIALACMAATGTGPMGLTDDMTAEWGSRINFEVYSSILFAEIYSNAVKHRANSHSAN